MLGKVPAGLASPQLAFGAGSRAKLQIELSWSQPGVAHPPLYWDECLLDYSLLSLPAAPCPLGSWNKAETVHIYP